jgi:hypothetical protein
VERVFVDANAPEVPAGGAGDAARLVVRPAVAARPALPASADLHTEPSDPHGKKAALDCRVPPFDTRDAIPRRLSGRSDSRCPWRRIHPTPIRRIEEAAGSRLVEKFDRTTDASGTTDETTHRPDPPDDPDAVADGDAVVVTLDGVSHRLDAATAAGLRESLGAALARRRTFLRTTCERRADGRYVVRRRGADSDGHSKVFESRAAAFDLFCALPEEFVAVDVECTGVSGNRRHLLVHHFAEHPEFPCELVSKQPLTARKT